LGGDDGSVSIAVVQGELVDSFDVANFQDFGQPGNGVRLDFGIDGCSFSTELLF
jgi:hypothetical protein